MKEKDKRDFYKQIGCTLLPANAITVYRALLHYASNKDMSCFPSTRTIANDTHLSRRTVIRQIRLLENEGYIVKCFRKREANGGDTSNLYFFNWIF